MRRNADGRSYVRLSQATTELLAGEADLAGWDDEELLRGYSRAKNGSFAGRPPTLVPMEIYQELVRRQLRRAEQEFASNVARSVESLVAISEDPDVDARTRLRAIEMIHDRVWGKPKERVELAPPLMEPEHVQMINAVTIDRDLPALEAAHDDPDFVFGDEEDTA